jgi:predicted Rdx family selenoprotein
VRAQFGQELLSTFGTQIGEIALIPATGGLFTVELVRGGHLSNAHVEVQVRVLTD